MQEFRSNSRAGSRAGSRSGSRAEGRLPTMAKPFAEQTYEQHQNSQLLDEVLSLRDVPQRDSHQQPGQLELSPDFKDPNQSLANLFAELDPAALVKGHIAQPQQPQYSPQKQHAMQEFAMEQRHTFGPDRNDAEYIRK